MRRMLWVFIALLAIATGGAQADVTYQYVVQGVANGGTLTDTVGQSVTLNLYLQETVTPSTNGGAFNVSVIASDGGLVGAAVSASLSNGSATITGVTANTVAAAARNGTNFSTIGESVTSTSSTASIIMFNPGGPNTFGTATSTAPVSTTTVNMVLLGSLTVTAGLTPGSTIVTVSGVSGGNSTVTAGTMWPSIISSGSDLDNTNNGNLGGPPPVYSGADDNPYSFTLQVNAQGAAVPEPSSMVLCGFAACSLGFGAWRRRQAKANAAKDDAEVPA